MKIRAKIETRAGYMTTKYYKHTSAGKPVFGSSKDAASFDPETAKKILEHLKTIDSRCANAELE